MKKKAVSLLLAAVLMVGAAGCATQGKQPDGTRQTPQAEQTPTSPKFEFTYEKDIWSDRKEECRQTLIERFLQDIEDTGYNLNRDFVEMGISFTQSTIEERENGAYLVIRGIVRSTETEACNFVKLNYALGDDLAEIPLLDRGDDVQNAKFFCDLADHPEDVTLEKWEINTQIDAVEFYEKYGEDIKYGMFIDGKGYDTLLRVYNELTGSSCRKISDMDSIADKKIELYTYVKQDVTFVGESNIVKDGDGYVGKVPLDVLTQAGALAKDDLTFTDRFQASVFSNDIYFFECTSDSEIDAVALIEDMASRGPMNVTKENHGVREVGYGSCESKDGNTITWDNGVILTGQEAANNFSAHDFTIGLSDTNVSIQEFTMNIAPGAFNFNEYST